MAGRGTKGTVYIACLPDRSFYKVGFTNHDGPARIKSLSQPMPWDLTLVLEKPGTWDQEQEIHDSLRNFGPVREWYKATPEFLVALRRERCVVLGDEDYEVETK